MSLSKVGIHIPEILLPGGDVDFSKWSVIACDQYTSQPEYWENVKKITEGKPSTLNLIFPEVYLESENEDKIKKSINDTMDKYVKDSILSRNIKGFVAVDRKTEEVDSRKGLVVALDLECYDYSADSKTLIRASEGTIIERIKPRVKIRKDAEIELPHIMVLIDDPEKTVIEPLFEKNLNKLYDCELMLGGGHIKGYEISSEEDISSVSEALNKLADIEFFKERYSVNDDNVLLYAMGDGNHSFATAKSIWEDVKAAAGSFDEVKDHPARYCLVELVNLHDEGLEFEPIHRLLFNVDKDDLFSKMRIYFEDQGSTITVEDSNNATLKSIADSYDSSVHKIPFIADDGISVLSISNPKHVLPVENLQYFLEKYLEESSVDIDYIHGEKALVDLSSKDKCIGFYLPAISKDLLFKAMIENGALPRKSFSMGEAEEKRYYIESRRIK